MRQVIMDIISRLLLDWATRQDAWIVEDDYDSEFSYTGNQSRRCAAWARVAACST